MDLHGPFTKQNIIILSVISILVCVPIWSFDYFLTQDGSAHLYSAYVIGEILKNNEFYTSILELNHLSTPNSSTHFIFALLLKIFPTLVLTKLTATVTLLSLPVSLTWLRYSTNGKRDLTLTFLYGLAISFNIFWLLGLYNFLFGIICLVWTLGFFYKWKQELSLAKAVILSILFVIIFLSHLISFLILAGSIFVITISVKKENLNRTATYIAAAFIPVILVFLHYFLTQTDEGNRFRPVWNNVENPFSVFQWIRQFTSVDIFIIISRKTFPFIEFSSSMFYLLTPLLWILSATSILMFITIYKFDHKSIFTREKLPFIFLFLFSTSFTLFAPDNFGETKGTLLRERVFICVFIFLVPIFKINIGFKWKTLITFLLSFVILFQTLAVFNYIFQTNKKASNFMQAKKYLSEGDTVATILILTENDLRFSSNPLAQINNINGIGINILIWDNYEFGHYLFPVVANTTQNRKIRHEFITSNVIDPKIEKTTLLKKIRSVNFVVADQKNDIDKIIIYGKDTEIENDLNFIKESTILYSDQYLSVYQLAKN